MKTILTNEKIYGFLVAGILVLGGYFINDVRMAIDLTRKHEIRFAGVDGMVQQVMDVRMQIDTIKNRQAQTDGKIDTLVGLFKSRTNKSERD